MQVKMIDQQYRKGNGSTKKYDDRMGLNVDLWTTMYATDLDIHIRTDDVYRLAEGFVKAYIDTNYGNGGYSSVRSIYLSRNGMTNLWQFTIETYEENMVFEVIEQKPQDVTEQYRERVQYWYDVIGINSTDGVTAEVQSITENGELLTATFICKLGVFDVDLHKSELNFPP